MKAMLVALPSGKQIDLDKDNTVIGRHPDNDVVATGKFVSRRHCAVVKKGIDYYVEDLKSSNGTFVNGAEIAEAVRLRNNDTISLGQQSRAYQFRRYSGAVRRVREFWRRPFHRILVIAGGVLFLGFLSYMFIFRFIGKVDVEQGLRRLEQRHGLTIFPRDTEFRDRVAGWIDSLTAEKEFAGALERFRGYRGMIEYTLERNNLPKDFSLIVWAESHCNPQARNFRSGAAGMWQLIPFTAKGYGLRVDRTKDERLDPERSTQAAALYLRDLSSILGKDSFLLVLAAYNAGDNAVIYGLRQIKDPVHDRNFWYMYQNDLLPAETKQYVLRIIALIIITDSM
jgi:hypothetical protein